MSEAAATQLPPPVPPAAAAVQPAPPAVPAPVQGVLPMPPPASLVPASAGVPPAAPSPAKGAQEPDHAAQLAALRQELHTTKIQAEVHRLALEARAINPEDVYMLTRDRFEVAEGKVIVKGDPATPPAKYLESFLSTRRHMLAPAVPAGAGASPVVTPLAAPPPPPDLRTAEGATQYMRAMVGARYAHLHAPPSAPPAAPSAPPSGRSP